AIEIPVCDFESFRIEREHALPSPPRVTHQAHATQGLEMTRDRLTGDAGTLTQPPDRERAVRGQAAEQPEPQRVAQGGEHRRGIDSLDLQPQGQVVVVRYRQPAPDGPAGGERAFELHAEPGAELFRIGDRAPHARAWRAEHDALLDPVSTHRGT